MKNVHISFPMSRLEWKHENKKNTKGGEEEKNCYLKFENERDFTEGIKSQ